MRGLYLILLLAAPFAVGAWAQVAEEDAWEASKCFSSYQEGEYDKAVDCVNGYLYAGIVTDTARLAKLYEVLGVCLGMLEKKGPARVAFNKLLDLKSDYELDPNVYLPEIISMFQIAKFQKRTSFKIIILDTVPAYPVAFNFAPGGVPQYLNEGKVKGAAVFLVQAAALGVSIYGYRREQSYLSDDYGLKEEDLSTARRFDALQKWSLLTFTVTYVYSLVDGFVNKRISVRQ